MGTKLTRDTGRTTTYTNKNGTQVTRRVMSGEHNESTTGQNPSGGLNDIAVDITGNTSRFDLGEYYEERDRFDNLALADIDSITANIPYTSLDVFTAGDKDTAVVVLRGLPGSGKSTIARDWMDQDDTRGILSRDIFRQSIYGGEGVLSKPQEQAITDMVNNGLVSNIEHGNSMIIDQTSLRRKEVVELGRIAVAKDADFAVVTIDLPLDTALKRARERAEAGGREVPEEAIRNMFKRYGQLSKQNPITAADLEKIKKAFTPYECVSGKTTDTVLFDIDGTLAKMKTEEGSRSPFDWDRVDEDDPNDPVIHQLKLNRAAGADIVIMSGRDSASREKTEQWLEKHGIEYDDLLMRPAGDTRKDDIIKRELLSHVENNYGPVVGVYDDRDQVVDMWREIGLPTFQVNYGDF